MPVSNTNWPLLSYAAGSFFLFIRYVYDKLICKRHVYDLYMYIVIHEVVVPYDFKKRVTHIQLKLGQGKGSDVEVSTKDIYLMNSCIFTCDCISNSTRGKRLEFPTLHCRLLSFEYSLEHCPTIPFVEVNRQSYAVDIKLFF